VPEISGSTFIGLRAANHEGGNSSRATRSWAVMHPASKMQQHNVHRAHQRDREELRIDKGRGIVTPWRPEPKPYFSRMRVGSRSGRHLFHAKVRRRILPDSFLSRRVTSPDLRAAGLFPKNKWRRFSPASCRGCGRDAARQAGQSSCHRPSIRAGPARRSRSSRGPR
jgi:hypothetical protein